MLFKKTFLAGALGAFCTLVVQLDDPVRHQLTFSAAKAGIVLGYVPPSNRPLLQRTEGAASRGCSRDRGTYLQLFAPRDHVAVTMSERPTFLAYMSRTELPLSFTLVEEGVPKPVFQREMRLSSPGVVKFQLPALKLKPSRYQWTVALVCNRKFPSKNTYVQVKFDRLPLDRGLQRQLKGKTPLQQAQVYARSGIWYEAIAKAHEANTAAKGDRRTQQSYLGLLDSIGLQKVTHALTNANQP
ncbi:hypothetical protein C7B80_21785 [Cyanosarcina cf. burmensis CCALA 770]|nr:hypothetical protein C7B80_21785 [Cyanosarcina cf. burmensis CCALA 770]